MSKGIEQYSNDSYFQEFLGREFDNTAANASMEELAEFAFGGMDAAIKAFELHRDKNK